MAREKIAISVPSELIRQVDQWVSEGRYPNRSRAFESGILELTSRRPRSSSFLAELSKLDPSEEVEIAEEFLDSEISWQD